MKSKLFYLLSVMLLAFVGNVKADELVVQNFELEPGQQTTVAVELNNPETQYIMLDFFLQLPTGVTIASDEDDELMYELNSTRAKRSHSLEIREQSNGCYHVLLYSSSGEALKGTSGAVFTMTLEADASATPGDYTGMLTNQLASDIDRNKIYFPDRSFNVTITAVTQPQSLSLDLSPMTYGDAPLTLPASTDQGLALTWTSSNTSVATVSGNTLTVKGAGEATITASNEGNANFNPFNNSYTLTVSKAVLTVTADDCTRMEGASNPDLTVSYSGFKYDDNASSLTTQPTASTEADASSPAGTYPITVSGGVSDNYEFNYVNGTLTVTAKSNQTIQLTEIAAKTYGDGAETLPASTEQGLALTWTSSNTSVATVSENTLTVKGAGEATITASNDGNANFNPFSKPFTLTVSRAVLTVTADDCSRMEGASNPDLTISYSGFKYDDNVSSLTTQPTASTEADASSPAGTYPITVSGGVSDNYEFNYVNGTLTVTAKSDQTIQLTEIAAKTYGDGAETLPASTEQGLALTWTSSNTSVATVSGNTLTVKGAGTSTITATQAGNGTYNSFSKTFTLTVNKAVLAVTADDCSRMEGAENPAFTISYSGFKYNDNASSLTTQPTASTTANASSPAGTYPITVSGGVSDNYEFNYVNGTLTVIEDDQDLYIRFADATVDSLCVSNWDTNGDGKLSYEEAAAVTDLGTVFKNNRTITSFNELQYFTGLTTIGDNAFYYCNGLTSLILPNSVTAIGSHAFGICKFMSIEIPNSVTTIGSGAFENSSIRSIEIPNSVISIGNLAFSGSGLRSVTIGTGVTSIGTSTAMNAFSNCSYLTKVTLNNNTIVSKTYTSSSNLKSIFGSQVTQYVIGNNVTSIGDYAFYSCREMNSLTIGNRVTSIGKYAFSTCSGLTSIEIPNRVTSIGNSAFSSCSGLTSIEIPNSVTSIGNSAFSSCSGLTSLAIGSGVASIGDNPFRSCGGLTSITVDVGNTVFDSRNNCNAIIQTSNNTLICGCKNTVIPNTVVTIGKYAFFGCKGLTSIEIPNSVTSIGSYAFSSCSDLTNVTIGNGVTSIGSSAFQSCSGITNMTIGNKVKKIGDYAFYGCSRLNDLVIPNSVTSIGTYAFYGCSGLTSLVLPSSVTSIGNYAFSCENLTMLQVCNSTPITITSYTFPYRTNTILFVPQGAKEAYEAADYWKEFKGIVCSEEDLFNTFDMSNLTVEHGAWIQLPIRMINQEQITAAEFDLMIPNSFSLLGCTLTERKNDHDISYSQLEDGVYHVTIFSLSSSAFKDNEGDLLNLLLLADAEGAHTVSLKNIELSTKDGSRRNPPSVSATVTISDIPIGDVNGDGDVTISDAVAIVNHRLGRTPARFVRAAADVNGDSEITITDAVRIVNMILSAEAGAKPRTQSVELSHEPQ